MQRLEGVLHRLDEAKVTLENRNALSKQLDELKNRIRELRKQLEDSSIDQKVWLVAHSHIEIRVAEEARGGGGGNAAAARADKLTVGNGAAGGTAGGGGRGGGDAGDANGGEEPLDEAAGGGGKGGRRDGEA